MPNTVYQAISIITIYRYFIAQKLGSQNSIFNLSYFGFSQGIHVHFMSHFEDFFKTTKKCQVHTFLLD